MFHSEDFLSHSDRSWAHEKNGIPSMLELTDMLHETLECREIESIISCQYVGSDFDHDGFGGHVTVFIK